MNTSECVPCPCTILHKKHWSPTNAQREFYHQSWHILTCFDPPASSSGRIFFIVTLRLHFIVEWECAVDCVLRCFWRRELLHVSTLLGHLQGELFCYRYTKVALYGWVRMCRWLCVTIDDKTLFVHLLVISVFVWRSRLFSSCETRIRISHTRRL
jgi:hypothetical protein